MNPYAKPLLAIASLACTALLPSCVDPYAASPRYAGPDTVSHGYRTGYVVNDLPHGYRTEVIDGSRYYVHNGNYFRSRSGRYVVVESPRDHGRPDYRRTRETVISTLPSGYRTINRGGTTYYESRGVYYRPTRSGYMMTERPY